MLLYLQAESVECRNNHTGALENKVRMKKKRILAVL